MKPKICLFSLLLFFLSSFAGAQQHPKREFRGAWIQTAFQSQYASMNRETMQTYLRNQLDRLQQTGINAVIFQVRPMADAFYPSELEPWSRFFTGTPGAAPAELWDPLEFMVNECHARNMELHAWVNPYRVSSNIREPLASNHIYFQHPEWFVQYGNGLYFDPGLPQSRAFINRVVDDIVSRYDIDAIHMDDYFYPYPVDGKPFPDDNSYALYHNGMTRDDWRRNNVNTLIEELHQTIRNRKYWVQFGISPFGIYRNKRSDADGSDTNGLQNYDDLYADVLLWAKNGW
ncbi:MAG: family 10 glycosylhydrolase, partial [Coprobacter sp.]|nr:family 10 glycosylhydrolase [Coprobacter sp.]